MGAKYLIRKRALGDVLWIEPIISTLAESNIKLVVFSKYNQLFENYPYKNVVFKDKLNFFEKILIRISKLPLLKNKVINLDDSYEKEPLQHFLHAYQTVAGLPLIEAYPKLYLSDNEKEMFRQQKIDGGYAVLHIENNLLKNYRRVFGISWETIVSFLKSRGKKVYILGDGGVKVNGAKNLTTTLREMIAMIYNADIFIGIDSGPSHIAAALSIPSVIFFGAVNPKFRHFEKLFKGIWLQKPCEFSGCFHTFKVSEKGTCRIVGDIGTPPCCSFATKELEESIDLVIKKYI